MAWILLILAGLFEVCWAVAMKQSQGFNRPGCVVLMVVFMVISFVLLAYAMKHLSMGTSYAVWTGIGAVGTVLAGIILFNEPKTFSRLLFVGLILAGIVGLHWVERFQVEKSDVSRDL